MYTMYYMLAIYYILGHIHTYTCIYYDPYVYIMLLIDIII